MRWRAAPVTLAAAALLMTGCVQDQPAAQTDPTATGDAGTATETGGDAGAPAASGDSVLQAVQDRGEVSCGVNDAVPGFGFVEAGGEFQGFDVDFCRALAAAVLGDSEAVEYRALTAEERFTALQSGEIDALIRNTTWTATRDGTEGATFLTTTFYDGQGMMVRTDSGAQALEDLQGANICVLSGTTTELNLATVSEARGLEYNPLSFEDNETLQAAFEQGQCDGWTSDKSQLAGVRSVFPEGPEALTILEETFSKEPLGPVVRDGDSQWAQIVDWVVIATMQAEEFGLDSGSIADADTSNPEIANFVGAPDPEEDTVLDPGLGLEPGWTVDVIEQVGNYAEIYDRNVGADGLGLERGLNALWTDGGLHYPPPYR